MKGKKGGEKSDSEKSDDRGEKPTRKKTTQKQKQPKPTSQRVSFWHEEVDPREVRFAHARIKPIFSGCGRTIDFTLDEIRSGRLSPSDLPTITVINNGGTLVSLNNRRLNVFKACREEGILETIYVRLRQPKPAEVERYTPLNCSLNAKFLFSGGGVDGRR